LAGRKLLIASFSRRGQNYVSGTIKTLATGNTEAVARALAALAGGELFAIRPAKPYPDDYYETARLAQDELRSQARPGLAATVEGWADYDTVALGYPNWWGTMPMAVYTFLEGSKWTGKTILPFCTHEGSGLGRSEAEIRRLCPGATVLPGLAMKGSSVLAAESELRGWLSTLGLLTAFR
jgi:flavodoxin